MRRLAFPDWLIALDDIVMRIIAMAQAPGDQFRSVSSRSLFCNAELS
jgi:hypothetical protein